MQTYGCSQVFRVALMVTKKDLVVITLLIGLQFDRILSVDHVEIPILLDYVVQLVVSGKRS